MSRHHRLTATLAAAALVATPAGAAAQDLRSADARDAGIQRGADLRTPDARDAGAVPVIVRVPPAPDTGIDWDSAAIGALAAAGLLVSAAGTAGLVARRRPAV